MNLIKEARMDRFLCLIIGKQKNLFQFSVQLWLFSLRWLWRTVSSPAASNVGPDVQHWGFCWLRDHHLSALPGKWLNRVLWLAINNNLRPFSPLLFSLLLNPPCPGGYRPGPDSENTPCKMWPSKKSPDSSPASKAFWDSITVNIPQWAGQPPGRRALCPSELDKAHGTVWYTCNVEIIESTQLFV